MAYILSTLADREQLNRETRHSTNERWCGGDDAGSHCNMGLHVRLGWDDPFFLARHVMASAVVVLPDSGPWLRDTETGRPGYLPTKQAVSECSICQGFAG